MKFLKEKLKYAEVLIKKGVNLQPHQNLHISAPIELSEFVDLLIQTAYQNQARFVYVEYVNPSANYLRLKYGNEVDFDYYPAAHAKQLMEFCNDNTAFLRIGGGLGVDMNEFDPKQITRISKANATVMQEYVSTAQGDTISCCGTALPTKRWAKELFPELDEEAALDTLWEKFLLIGKCFEEQPTDLWDQHIKNIIKRRDYLNKMQFEYLQFKNQESDVCVELIEDHKWVGGCQITDEGVAYMPNFPTEEIFCANKKYGINGIVKNSKPLLFQGNLIDDFTLTFKDGRIVEATAKTGQAYLEQLLNFDEGCRYCGEIALLGGTTEISKTNIVYKNTLLDENAACHMAIGCAYTCNVKGLSKKDKDAFEKRGVNFSTNHSDYMFGNEEINVTAYKNGKAYSIIENGEWKI